MWRVTVSTFGFIINSEHESLQACIEEIHDYWKVIGFDNIDWYRIEEYYDNKWYQRGFLKMA